MGRVQSHPAGRRELSPGAEARAPGAAHRAPVRSAARAGADRASAPGGEAGSTAGMCTRTAVPGYRAIGARGSHNERIEGSVTQRVSGAAARAPCAAAAAIGQAPPCAGPAIVGQVADRSQRADVSSGATGPPHCASTANGRSAHRRGQERGVGAEAKSVATIRGGSSQRDPGGRRIVP
jgi:hypothetical protein